jgi:hypothetical protein
MRAGFENATRASVPVHVRLSNVGVMQRGLMLSPLDRHQGARPAGRPHQAGLDEDVQRLDHGVLGYGRELRLDFVARVGRAGVELDVQFTQNFRRQGGRRLCCGVRGYPFGQVTTIHPKTPRRAANSCLKNRASRTHPRWSWP